jgi:hypothetical protein
VADTMIAIEVVQHNNKAYNALDGTPATGRTVTLSGATFTQVEGDLQKTCFRNRDRPQ